MTVKILIGDCREVLRSLPSGSIHTCITSPPYFGLRDYGTAVWEGGSAECDHLDYRTRGVDLKESKQSTSQGSRPNTHRQCRACGALRTDSQIGLEDSPEAFVAQMVGVFAEVRRVLRDDGTLWLNMGDSYSADGGPGWQGKNGDRADRRFTAVRGNNPRLKSRAPTGGLKPKDLIGIPWRTAFALQQDGWFLRQDIIWAKPNPMPESVTDRCTKSHEYLFLLTKSSRYYFDREAISEKAVSSYDPENVKAPDGWASHEGRHSTIHKDGREKGRSGNKARKNPAEHGGNPEHTDNQAYGVPWEGITKNKRSVWTVATQPFSGAHFATFPPKLIKPCILAGCPTGGTVLDPFGGAGTTGLVSDRCGRHAVLIELNPIYAAMARSRLRKDSPLFAEIS